MATADILRQTEDTDPAETKEWVESLKYVLEQKGPSAAGASTRPEGFPNRSLPALVPAGHGLGVWMTPYLSPGSVAHGAPF